MPGGAKLADGYGEPHPEGDPRAPHDVSADGSRVFFEAVPSANCAEPPDLYVREDGSKTVEIGAYKFVAANAEGSKLLLEKVANGDQEFLSYETEHPGSFTPLLTVPAGSICPAMSPCPGH